jgi:hypothetical protein
LAFIARRVDGGSRLNRTVSSSNPAGLAFGATKPEPRTRRKGREERVRARKPHPQIMPEIRRTTLRGLAVLRSKDVVRHDTRLATLNGGKRASAVYAIGARLIGATQVLGIGTPIALDLARGGMCAEDCTGIEQATRLEDIFREIEAPVFRGLRSESWPSPQLLKSPAK